MALVAEIGQDFLKTAPQLGHSLLFKIFKYAPTRQELLQNFFLFLADVVRKASPQ